MNEVFLEKILPRAYAGGPDFVFGFNPQPRQVKEGVS
jgi:hypothetical protein